jgi:hypothetical protein
MKKIILCSFICFFSIQIFSQNVTDRKVNFEYIRLPLQPLSKSIKNYQASVALEYEAEVKARKEAFAKSVVEADKRYEQEVANYDKSVKDAGVRYAQDMAAYKVNKRLHPELQEPVLVLPNKPEKSLLTDTYYYPKTQNQENLANTYINLNGYNKSIDNAVLVTAMLKGFQYTEPELKFSEISKTKDGVTTKEKEYYYELSYKHPMGLKVEVPGGQGVVFNEYFEDLNRYSVHRTQKYKTEYDLILSFNKANTLSSFEDKIIADNLRYINEVLNNRFGFTKLNGQEEIFLVQGKKFNYNDFQQAFEATTLGLGQLSADVNRTVAAQNLNSAVNIWENALKESQPNNKKARVNGNVTTAALFNAARVSVYAYEFGKAEIYLNKIFASDASRKEQRRVEQIKAFMKDQQSRYEAYKNRN